ncbi:MAG: beta-lactamase family protein [bacterium]|nr:beta-lactamase family protein [bacterium]
MVRILVTFARAGAVTLAISCCAAMVNGQAFDQGQVDKAPGRTVDQQSDRKAALAAHADRMFRRCSKPGVPGAAVLVTRGDEVLLRRAYGLADLEREVALTPESVFDIASTSKQFTAASVLLLEGDGELALSDSVCGHISELPECMRPVTVRHLMFHTSGIPDYISLMLDDGVDVEDRTSTTDALAVIGAVEKLQFAAGSKWSYSNSNYLLLSEIVDRVAGRPLAEFAAERIFEPLEMKSTRVRTDTRVLIPRRALSYSPVARGQWVMNYSNWEQTGDGAVHTTVDDLRRWLVNLSTFEVGGDHLRRRLAGPGALDDGTPIDYGFGLVYSRWHGHETVSHGGSWAGYRSDVLLVPAAKLVVICLCNRSDLSPGPVCKSLARKVLEPR